jgi:hypothetical protein
MRGRTTGPLAAVSFPCSGRSKRSRTMGHLVLNSEQWAWIMICGCCIGTAALLLTSWLQQEVPKPHPWLISPQIALVSLLDVGIEDAISPHVLSGGKARREKFVVESQIVGVGVETSHERLVAGTADPTTLKTPAHPVKRPTPSRNIRLSSLL